MPDTTATFGGVTRVIAGSYTAAWGTTPGQARLTTGYGFGTPGAIGTLEFKFRGQSLKLFDALVVDPTFAGGVNDAPKTNFIALDRRWKWQFRGRVTGDFNFEKKDGSLIRQKGPRDMAAELFTALGETNFDVSALPTDPRPRVVWDYVQPADELNRLCADFGCVVVFNPISNRASVEKVGVGRPPTANPFISRSDSLIWPVPPDGVEVVGGPVLFQSALALGEAVGRDVDNGFKPINSLSYKPPGGWESIEPHQFRNLDTEYTDPATGTTLYHRDLAQSSVWRCYRISGQAAGGFSPLALKGTSSAPASIKDLGPFTGSLLDKDAVTDERLPCYVRGVFADARFAFDNSKPNTRFPGSVSIDNEQRIVTFDKPLFKYDGNGRPAPADVVLIAAYQCTSGGVKNRAVQHTPTGFSNGAGDKVERHDSITREIIEASASSYGGARDNIAKVTAEMTYYLDALKSRYAEATATQATYGGFVLDRSAKLDGVLRSVTYSFSKDQAPTTSCSWNCERSAAIQSWENRHEARAVRVADAAARRAAAQAQVAASREAVRIQSQ